MDNQARRDNFDRWIINTPDVLDVKTQDRGQSLSSMKESQRPPKENIQRERINRLNDELSGWGGRDPQSDRRK